MMPNVLLQDGIRFFFYSNENNEPIHIHVTKGDAIAKIWLEPFIQIAYSYGFTKAEEKNVVSITEKNSDNFKNKWDEYFNK